MGFASPQEVQLNTGLALQPEERCQRPQQPWSFRYSLLLGRGCGHGMAVLGTAGSAQWWLFLESRCLTPHIHRDPCSESSEVFHTYILYIYKYMHIYTCWRVWTYTLSSSSLPDWWGWTLRGAMCCYVNMENSIT